MSSYLTCQRTGYCSRSRLGNTLDVIDEKNRVTGRQSREWLSAVREDLRQGEAAFLALRNIVEEAKHRHLEDEAAFSTGRPTDYLWLHVERVQRLCRRIGELEGADLEILELAALLHDVAKFHADQHARPSAEIAEGLLRRNGFPGSTIDAVRYAIMGHDPLSAERRTLEAKILADADILDKFGAVGVARMFLKCALDGQGFRVAVADQLKVLDAIRHHVETESAKGILEERSAFTQLFLNRLEKESLAEL